MKLDILLIFAFLSVQRLEGHSQNTISEINRKHLVNIINSLNGRNGVAKKFDDDEVELNDEEKEEKLQEVLSLLKKNYKAGVQHDAMMKNPIHSGSRLYFIKNPEVLEEYKNYLRTKIYSTSSSEDSSDISDYRKRNLKLENSRKDGSIHLELTEKSDSGDDESNENGDKVKDNKMKISEDAVDEPLDSLDIHNKEHHIDEIGDEKDRKEEADPGAMSYRSKKSDENYKTTKEIDFDATPGYKKKYMHVYKPKKSKNKLRSDLAYFGRTSIPFAAFIFVIKSRKFDIEQEAFKLYGENFKSVVQKFRQTPEYLQILKSEMEEMKKNLDTLEEQTMQYYFKYLEEEIKKELGIVNTTRSFLRTRKPIFRPTVYHRTNKTKVEKSPVDVLDKYDALYSYLTLAERNHIRDMAYNYFGKAVHELIYRWSPSSNQIMSTKLPHGGDQPLQTTKKHVHEITSPTETTEISTTAPHHHRSTAVPDSHRLFPLPNVI